MNPRTAALTLAMTVTVAALAVLGTLRWANALGPDVTGDGLVRVDDILGVVHAYYTNVPTPTPVAATTVQTTTFGGQTNSSCASGPIAIAGSQTQIVVDRPTSLVVELAMWVFYNSADPLPPPGKPVRAAIVIDDTAIPPPISGNIFTSVGQTELTLASHAAISVGSGTHIIKAGACSPGVALDMNGRLTVEAVPE